jgi:hypothetical protein
VRKLEHQSGAVSTRGVGVNASTVRQMNETFEGLFNDAMGRRRSELGHEAYAAGIVLLAMIESELRNWGKPGHFNCHQSSVIVRLVVFELK